MRPSLHSRIEVVSEDTDYILIDKASGVLSYPVEGRSDEAAIQLIRRYWKARGMQNSHLYLIHRLDQDTSGLMIFAKTTLARESLRVQFENHSVLRSYVAVTQGVPRNERGTLETRLGRDTAGRRAVAEQGRTAVTHYEICRVHPARGRAIVRCRLHTGRTHQVRIHLAHLGAPVVGDVVYGKRQGGRLMLHAEALGFIHPRTGRVCVFRTSLPQVFHRAL